MWDGGRSDGAGVIALPVGILSGYALFATSGAFPDRMPTVCAADHLCLHCLPRPTALFS